jgi:glycosyltransferase involved in cell wall biosynthesis
VDPWIAQRADATFLTVFDMIGELLCDESSRVRSLELKRRGAQIADLLFCISRQTERDFVSLLPEFESRTRVTPLATSLPLPAQEDLALAQARTPYLLLVGNRAGYKNGVTAVRAFCQLAPSHPDLRLVFFGGEPVLREERSLLESAGAWERTCQVSGDDGRLAAFYNCASALLYPSRYEGFGLPVLEAMSLGCPVVTTRCASLPEVAGAAAIYADPDRADEFAAATDRLLQDAAWRQSWVDQGHTRSHQFSWAETANLTRAGYETILAER